MTSALKQSQVASLSGAGLGLRRDFCDELWRLPTDRLPDFVEVAPENWIGYGGRYSRLLHQYTDMMPLVCHGLSLSIGGVRPLNKTFILQVKEFLAQHQVVFYSEHLSYTDDGSYLYDLMPIPMTMDAVRYVAERVLQVQDWLGRRLVLENVSTYMMPGAQMSEAEFVRAVVELADCDLLLDINNVYVNAINHGSSAYALIDAMPSERVKYLHIAGHDAEDPKLRIDTHGESVCDDVWKLLAYSYQKLGIKPTLLERDFNIPPLPELLDEVNIIRQAQQRQAALLVDVPVPAHSDIMAKGTILVHSS